MTTTTTRPTGLAGPHPGSAPRGRRLRVALYSHDALGLGHVRRNLAIARALTTLGPAPDVLLLTGAPEAVTTHRPAHCDLVSLPALTKDAAGTYSARHLSVDEAHIRHMRRAVLTAALSSFRPDVLVVDKHPRGFLGELEPALDLLRAAGTRIVLGLRDVLDDAATSRREWDTDRGAQALRRWYDQVWVYGDRAVHDLTAELDLPAARTVHTGYLATGRQGGPAVTEVVSPYVLAMVGGGSDGAHLAEAFVRSAMPAGHHGVLVTGPQMPADDVRRVAEIAAHRTDLTVRTYVEDAEALIGGAAAVVAMGGYNTVCEALALGARLLVVPRVRPRQEQLVRARLLTAVGVLDHLHPQRLDPPALERWLAGAVTAPAAAPGPGDVVDLDGLARLPHLLASLVATKEETDVA
ncbi:glycosyltransferase family protein [Oceanitalea stevensii]|uniref:Glycosyltransferase n=1 Tax=Oceanitalea stevensii TaxID=2763072 RepID=A0ABR8Z5C8_9MICO|nr:glycosyltransferase [Oceanitalea stevensii]MBD8063536.1 glycosyltransferase [Oceanitalea stevensii]